MNAVLKILLNHKKRILQILIVLVIVVVLLVFASAGYIITIDDGVSQSDKAGNTPSTVKKSVEKSALSGDLSTLDLNTKASTSGGYALNVDLDEITDSIIAELEENGGTLDRYLTSGNKHEYLKKMIKAEYVTQYPDLRTADKIGTTVPSNEFQGVIRFRRHKSDGNEQILQYISLGSEDSTDGNTLNGLIYLANHDDQDAKDKVLNRFSIDNNGNLIIANWSQTISKTVSGEYETEYKADDVEEDYSETDSQNLNNVSEQISYEYTSYSINYKSAISKYTMPFNYLWAFLVCGHDEQFVSDLADLAINSSIEIGIYDNLTEIEDTTIDSYNDNLWKSTRTAKRTVTTTIEGRTTKTLCSAENVGEWSELKVDKTSHHYDINYTKTLSNAIVIAVTNVDIWYMKYTASYTYEVKDPDEQKEVTRTESETVGDPDTADFIEETVEDSDTDDSIEETVGDPDNSMKKTEGQWKTVNSKTTREPKIGLGGHVGGYENIITKTTEDQERIDTATQNQKNQRAFTTLYRIVQYNYTLNGDPTVQEKTDKTLKQGDEGYPNFSTLYTNSICAKGNITGTESWLFEIIQKNQDTTNMLELTKYMLYCAMDINYGVTSYDFTSLFASIGRNSFVGGTVEAKVWFAMIDAGYSPEATAGAMGNFQAESGFFTNNLWNTAEGILGMSDEQYTSSTDDGTYLNFLTDDYAYGLAQWKGSRKVNLYNLAKSKGVSVGDPDMQIEYLFDELNPSSSNFQMGSTINGFNYSSWLNASSPEIAAEAWCYSFERPEGFDSKRSVYARQIYDNYKDVQRSTFASNANVNGDGYSGIYTSSSGKSYYEFKQYLGPWKDKSYASGTMSNKGCYCTATAIIASSFNSSLTPEDVRITKNGQGLASATGFLRNNNITCNEKSGVTREEIVSYLSAGRAVMIHVNSSSTYTNNEHWMALIDIDGDSVYISNPSSLNKTGWQSLTQVMVGLDRAIFV